ncbi:hypothetical protein MTO96_021766 [Rhipicephalus appendiculatus]
MPIRQYGEISKQSQSHHGGFWWLRMFKCRYTLAPSAVIGGVVRKENEVMFRIPTPPPGLLSSTGSVVTVLQENTTMASLTAAG